MPFAGGRTLLFECRGPVFQARELQDQGSLGARTAGTGHVRRGSGRT